MNSTQSAKSKALGIPGAHLTKSPCASFILSLLSCGLGAVVSDLDPHQRQGVDSVALQAAARCVELQSKVFWSEAGFYNLLNPVVLTPWGSQIPL